MPSGGDPGPRGGQGRPPSRLRVAGRSVVPLRRAEPRRRSKKRAATEPKMAGFGCLLNIIYIEMIHMEENGTRSNIWIYLDKHPASRQKNDRKAGT